WPSPLHGPPRSRIASSAPDVLRNRSSTDMPKRNAKQNEAKSTHEAYELPRELDFEKLKFVGIGPQALETYAVRRKMTVELDPDVARVFDTSDSVNAVLRAIIQSLSTGKKRRK